MIWLVVSCCLSLYRYLLLTCKDGQGSGVLNLLSGVAGEGIETMMVMTPPRPRYVGQPAYNTPPSTMPIYNVLPPIISLSDQMHMEDSDYEILAPLAEAFRPPLSTTTKKSTKNKNSNNKDTKVIKNGDNSSLGNPPVRTRPPYFRVWALSSCHFPILRFHFDPKLRTSHCSRFVVCSGFSRSGSTERHRNNKQKAIKMPKPQQAKGTKTFHSDWAVKYGLDMIHPQVRY